MSLENIKKQIHDKVLDLLNSGVSHFPKPPLSHKENDSKSKKEDTQSLVFLTESLNEKTAMVKNLLQKLNILEKTALIHKKDLVSRFETRDDLKTISHSLREDILKHHPKKILCFGFQTLRQLALIVENPFDVLYLHENSKMKVHISNLMSFDLVFLPHLSELLLTPELRKPVWHFLKKEYENSD